MDFAFGASAEQAWPPPSKREEKTKKGAAQGGESGGKRQKVHKKCAHSRCADMQSGTFMHCPLHNRAKQSIHGSAYPPKRSKKSGDPQAQAIFNSIFGTPGQLEKADDVLDAFIDKGEMKHSYPPPPPAN